MPLSGSAKIQGYEPACIHIPPTRHIPDLVEDVRSGLLSRPRCLPSKYFYDDLGAELFEKICDTEEYYPTRTEEELLLKYSKDIIEETLPDHIIELGSGSSRKTRRLFDACEESTHICGYAPFDVCEPALNQAAAELNAEYNWLEVTPLVGDYHAGLGNLPSPSGTGMVVFLGSTIGNFTPAEAEDFIEEIRGCMRPGDYFLLGADRIKDSGVLHAAYNDSSGVTAEFNLNVLRVLNRELDADFDLDSFSHQAIFNAGLKRIEMYLISKADQQIEFGKINETIFLRSGEKILTELSHKFHYAELEAMLMDKGFDIIRHFEPANRYFSLVLSRLLDKGVTAR